jgi:energy-coupling factor transport system permease protein
MTRATAIILWVFAGLAISLTSSDPAVHLVVAAAGWLLLLRRRQPIRSLRPLAIGLGLLTVVTVVTNGLLDHLGASVIVSVPSWVPLLGGPLTVEAFLQGGAIALGLIAAVSVAGVLSVVLEPSEIIDVLPSFLDRTAAALGAALNLVPATAASVAAVRDAQRLRGWRMHGPRDVVDLAVPVLLGAIERSTQLAESMEARGFGSGRRTRLGGAKIDRRTMVLIGLSVLLVLTAIALTVLGVDPGWAAYPTPEMPSFSPILLAPALLLGVGTLLVPHGERP